VAIVAILTVLAFCSFKKNRIQSFFPLYDYYRDEAMYFSKSEQNIKKGNSSVQLLFFEPSLPFFFIN